MLRHCLFFGHDMGWALGWASTTDLADREG